LEQRWPQELGSRYDGYRAPIAANLSISQASHTEIDAITVSVQPGTIVQINWTIERDNARVRDAARQVVAE
jgi:hypothetical protein